MRGVLPRVATQRSKGRRRAHPSSPRPQRAAQIVVRRTRGGGRLRENHASENSQTEMVHTEQQTILECTLWIPGCKLSAIWLSVEGRGCKVEKYAEMAITANDPSPPSRVLSEYIHSWGRARSLHSALRGLRPEAGFLVLALKCAARLSLRDPRSAQPQPPPAPSPTQPSPLHSPCPLSQPPASLSLLPRSTPSPPLQTTPHCQDQ